MTIDADPDRSIEPEEKTGVSGENGDTTRTETTFPLVRLAHEDPVHEPDGAPPLGLHLTNNCEVVK